jgi:hypothetical protein
MLTETREKRPTAQKTEKARNIDKRKREIRLFSRKRKLVAENFFQEGL